jgi:hypothetical protein
MFWNNASDFGIARRSGFAHVDGKAAATAFSSFRHEGILEQGWKPGRSTGREGLHAAVTTD